ncbi:MAG: HAD family phosphatase [Actinomycetia bacterium]|nr:HAD family phosphatase [Actinomycetes bacterium]
MNNSVHPAAPSNDPAPAPVPPAAVLWDMDGTLVDTEPYWIAAEHALVEEFGGEWTEELGLQLVGQNLWASAEFIRAHSPVTLEPAAIIDRLLERVSAAVRDEGVPWRPGARELLEAVAAAGIPSALVTMSWMALVEPILASLPERTFAVIASGDVVAHGKPHPEPYLHAARELGLEPAQCLAIEDSPTGVTSATAAGVPTLAVPHIVDIPAMAGALPVDTLVGLTTADLAALRERAAASFS